ncbi:MAG: hypothetical protein SW833_06235 [Cyanobacteriota bacterium]|nr:hypothetical protein [Cyanobacteriota bacterium]
MAVSRAKNKGRKIVTSLIHSNVLQLLVIGRGGVTPPLQVASCFDQPIKLPTRSILYTALYGW